MGKARFHGLRITNGAQARVLRECPFLPAAALRVYADLWPEPWGRRLGALLLCLLAHLPSDALPVRAPTPSDRAVALVCAAQH